MPPYMQQWEEGKHNVPLEPIIDVYQQRLERQVRTT